MLIYMQTSHAFKKKSSSCSFTPYFPEYKPSIRLSGLKTSPGTVGRHAEPY